MASNTTAVKRDPYADLPPVPSFCLESSLVADGETMPIAQRDGVFGAGGQGSSPDLTWWGFPDETQSFIITMYDPDAPTPSGFWHWAVINLPVSVASLSAGAGEGDRTLPEGSAHLPNDASLRRYLGAGPPPGDPPHRYFIVVSALDIPEAGVPATATPALALFHTRANTVARAMLVPVYGA
jgi:Raf kinase inhibitor-like YbhB/YbcL family protein